MNVSAKPLPGLRRREQLSDEVAAHLRAAIMSGTLRPGAFVRLDETAAALGVSITPVREALRTLRCEGMVELEPNRGHVVSAFTRDDIADIFWLQATIATEIAEKPLVAAMLAKEAVNQAFEMGLAEGLRFERRLFHAVFASEDQSIGMTAFAEKQKPAFKHR